MGQRSLQHPFAKWALCVRGTTAEDHVGRQRHGRGRPTAPGVWTAKPHVEQVLVKRVEGPAHRHISYRLLRGRLLADWRSPSHRARRRVIPHGSRGCKEELRQGHKRICSYTRMTPVTVTRDCTQLQATGQVWSHTITGNRLRVVAHSVGRQRHSHATEGRGGGRCCPWARRGCLSHGLTGGWGGGGAGAGFPSTPCTPNCHSLSPLPTTPPRTAMGGGWGA